MLLLYAQFSNKWRLLCQLLNISSSISWCFALFEQCFWEAFFVDTEHESIDDKKFVNGNILAVGVAVHTKNYEIWPVVRQKIDLIDLATWPQSSRVASSPWGLFSRGKLQWRIVSYPLFVYGNFPKPVPQYGIVISPSIIFFKSSPVLSFTWRS